MIVATSVVVFGRYVAKDSPQAKSKEVALRRTKLVLRNRRNSSAPPNRRTPPQESNTRRGPFTHQADWRKVAVRRPIVQRGQPMPHGVPSVAAARHLVERYPLSDAYIHYGRAQTMPPDGVVPPTTPGVLVLRELAAALPGAPT